MKQNFAFVDQRRVSDDDSLRVAIEAGLVDLRILSNILYTLIYNLIQLNDIEIFL